MSLLKTLMAEKLNKSANGRTVPMTGRDVTIAPVPGEIYQCGVLSNLTVTASPEMGLYCIVFSSGPEPTTTVFPVSVLGLEHFAAKANTIYEISVQDNRALAASWEGAADAN